MIRELFNAAIPERARPWVVAGGLFIVAESLAQIGRWVWHRCRR